MRKPILFLILLLVSACSETTDTAQTIQLVRPNLPTGKITLRNNQDFTVGVVSFMDCKTKAVAKPARQQILPGETATYELSAGCYRIVSGEAGLSFNYLTDATRQLEAGQHIILP